MELRTGTSGYSYKEWKGSFYPEDLPSGEMLRHYAGRLDAVEINNTFYRLPKPSVLEGWAEQVPDAFRFSIKASRKITHFTRLKEEAADATGFLLSSLETLGPLLGAVLFQLPPNFKKDVERLERFLDVLPDGTPAAFEFRHASWRDETVLDLLRGRDMAWVCADTDDDEERSGDGGGEVALVETASWGYLRLRRSSYSEEELQRWMDGIAATGWERALVFFKHEDEAAGPRMARRFAELHEG